MATTALAATNSARAEEVLTRRIPLATLVALLAGAVANVALLQIGQAAGALSAITLPNGQVFGLGAVISVTAMGAVGGAVVYAIIGAIGRIRRPITVYRIVALGVYLLSLLTPFSIPDVGAGFIVFLELMHVATAAAIVWALTTLAGRRA